MEAEERTALQLPSGPGDVRRETHLGRYEFWSKQPVRVFANCIFEGRDSRGDRNEYAGYLRRLRGATPLSVSCAELLAKVRKDKNLSDGARHAITNDLRSRAAKAFQIAGEAFRFSAKLDGRIYKGTTTRREPVFSETAGRRFACTTPEGAPLNEAVITIRQLGMVSVRYPNAKRGTMRQGQRATGFVGSEGRDSRNRVELNATAKGRSEQEITSVPSSYNCADGTQRQLFSGPLAPEQWKPLDDALGRADRRRLEEGLFLREFPGRLGKRLRASTVFREPEPDRMVFPTPSIMDPAPNGVAREFFYRIRLIPCRNGGKAPKPKRC